MFYCCQVAGGAHPSRDVAVRWIAPRHVWVSTTGWGSTGIEVGIQLAWRCVPDASTDGGRWEAFVIRASSYPGRDQRVEPSISQGWVASHHIRVREAPPPSS
jgi:hypothetical protein